MADLPGTATVEQADTAYDPLRPVEALTDPSAVEFIAAQLNDETLNQNRAQGAPQVNDLTACIADIVITTVAQGSGTIEVHIIDPYWVLMARHGTAPAFFDVDDSGLLIPVDVNFPSGTDRWWRLAQANPNVDPTTPNVFVFEDRIVTELRDRGGPRHAGNGQTRAQFIYSCVRQVPEIRFVCPALTLPAGSVGGDITQGAISAAANPLGTAATNPNAPAARRNPHKKAGIGRGGKHNGAYWTKGGWRYTKPTNGLSPKVLSILNPPTNQADGPPATGPGSAVGNPISQSGGGIGGF